MSDSAFKTAAYPGYTTAQLRNIIAANKAEGFSETKYAPIVAEIERRALVAAGDISVMTDGERLRFIRTGKAR